MDNQIINTNPTPISPSPTPQKSGCGCCGCLMGCLFMFFLPIFLLGVVYFTVDLGNVADQTVAWGYREIFRPKIIEPSLAGSLNPAQRKEALKLADQFLDDYLVLPAGERKFIRQELTSYIYYRMQDKNPPPEDWSHLNRFIESERLKFKNNPVFPLLNNPIPNTF